MRLARDAIRHYLTTGRLLDVSGLPGDRPAQGVFVSLHEPAPPGVEEGPLRGCIGSIGGTQPTLFGEIARQAVNAAVSDPRFRPLTLDEVDELSVTVYLLGPPEPVDSLEDLDPERYGVIVEAADGRRGLLLPDLPGVDSPGLQVAIASQKAGIAPGEPVRLYRFEAEIIGGEPEPRSASSNE